MSTYPDQDIQCTPLSKKVERTESVGVGIMVSIAVIFIVAVIWALAYLLSLSVSWVPSWLLNSPFITWPTASVGEFATLMVTYVFMCIVTQNRRSFFFEVAVFILSFALWFIAVVHVEAPQFLSTSAVLLAIVGAVLSPIVKGDTVFIWSRQAKVPTS